MTSAASARKPRQGDEVELEITDFDGRGRGVAEKDGYSYAVKRGTTGAFVRALILRRRGTSIEAVALETLRASPFAVEPACAHFGACGGCSLQDLAYERQLAGLARLVERSLRARLRSDYVLADVVPAPAATRYRNKMEFSFSTRRFVASSEPADAPNGFALGLHAAGVHQKVVDVRACAIQSSAADAVLATVRAEVSARAVPLWDPKSHTGLLRHLVLRRAGSTGELLVNLVTSTEAREVVDDLARAIVGRHPWITTFVQNVNSRPADTAIGDPGRERVLFGTGTIRERVLGLEFALSAGSFFQTNSAQAERLFEIVREECAVTGRETIFDLYCGTGVIALVLARAAREVIGFEIVPSAVADARKNALENGLANVRFVEGDALDGLSTAGLPPPDVVVVDPPRAGLSKRVLPRLAALGARRIVYVSCHHPAAAHDASALEAQGWRVERVRPIDMFPHTPHVECVLTLVPASS